MDCSGLNFHCIKLPSGNTQNFGTEILENMFGGRTCRTRDIIQIKVEFVENVFEVKSWKVNVPNYVVGPIVTTLTAES